MNVDFTVNEGGYDVDTDEYLFDVSIDVEKVGMALDFDPDDEG